MDIEASNTKPHFVWPRQVQIEISHPNCAQYPKDARDRAEIGWPELSSSIYPSLKFKCVRGYLPSSEWWRTHILRASFHIERLHLSNRELKASKCLSCKSVDFSAFCRLQLRCIDKEMGRKPCAQRDEAIGISRNELLSRKMRQVSLNLAFKKRPSLPITFEFGRRINVDFTLKIVCPSWHENVRMPTNRLHFRLLCKSSASLELKRFNFLWRRIYASRMLFSK